MFFTRRASKFAGLGKVQRGRLRAIAGLSAVLGAITLVFVGCLKLAQVARSRPELVPPSRLPVDRLIRVRLGGRKERERAGLEVTSPFAISNTTSGEVLVEGHPRLRPTILRAAPGGGIELGSERFASDDLLIRPKRDASIVIESQTYRGMLRIQRVGDGLVLDNHVDVEAYLRGVLRGELPRYFHPESFRAQAVAARTYVLYQKRNTPPTRSFDVFDHEGSQVYIGVRGEDRIAVQAVADTQGEVCVWSSGGTKRIFCTYYSSTCGGRSQHVNNVKPNDPPVGPLTGNVVCEDCYLARFYRWKPVTLSKEKITERLLARYPSLAKLGTISGLRPKARNRDGRIIRMELLGSTGACETLIAEDFRLSVGGRTLKSTHFAIEAHKDHFIFKNGKGYGHGIGLCQHGMETKARRGMDYKRILTTYYPGASVKKIY